jgi:carboxyl-terminal processing protease
MLKFMQGRSLWATVAAGALLGACGGGGGDSGGSVTPPPASCAVADQKNWLSTYMNDWYFWYRLSPQPNAASFNTVADYFDALLYTGGTAPFPKDRYSRFESTESFNRFFGDGATMGWGVTVAGLEVTGQPSQPLYVRYIEALSPAAAQDVRRGDQILSINGRAAADIIAADDFSALTANNAGDTLNLRLRRGTSERTVVLTAAVFNLTPVPTSTVMNLPNGRKLGYLVVKDMVSQSLTPIDNAFARFKSEGVSDLVLDLRYNGGGLVSVGATLASYIAGNRGTGRNYAALLYNDKRSASNTNYAFTNPAASLGLAKVYVLMGRRTCSASEQVINGLRGVGVDVIAIGETTCGKPVGFLPSSSCGSTYSVVNFESVNARNEGRYFDGFAASCSVAEDFTKPLGHSDEPLLSAAKAHAEVGACLTLQDTQQALATKRALGATRDFSSSRRGVSDERDSMLDR